MIATIRNCYGNGNLGDDLCHYGAILGMNEHFDGRLSDFRQIIKINNETAQMIMRSDIFVVGGGQLLDRSDILSRLVSFYRKYNIETPVYFIGVGIGDKNDVEKHIPFLKSINCHWNVRDAESLDILRGFGIDRFFGEIGDASEYLTIPKASNSREITGGMVLKNIHKSNEFIERIASFITQTEMRWKLFAFNPKNRHKIKYHGEDVWVSDCNDEDLALRIVEKVGCKDFVEVVPYKGKAPTEYAFELSECSFLITERYHGAVLAHRFQKPFISMPYHKKVERFVSEYHHGFVNTVDETREGFNRIMEFEQFNQSRKTA